MQPAAVDFDDVTLDDDRLVVTGRCDAGATVRLVPRRYKVQPRWVEVDVVAEHTGSTGTATFRSELAIGDLWGHDGVCVVGAGRRRFVPRPSATNAETAPASPGNDTAAAPASSESTTAPAADDAGATTKAASAGVLVTTLLRIDPASLDALTAALRRHPSVTGGDSGWLDAWCAIDHERAEVLVHTRWTDEISYRRAVLTDAFHHAEQELHPLLVDDSDVFVADLLFTP